MSIKPLIPPVEIVGRLRNTCNGCNPTPCCEFEALGPAAADLIESQSADIERLTAQLAEATQLAFDITQKYETSVKMHKVTADLLAESQCRERAAVADLKAANLCNQCAHNARCGSVNHYRQQKNIWKYCDHWEWRGPQAGKERRNELRDV